MVALSTIQITICLVFSLIAENGEAAQMKGRSGKHRLSKMILNGNVAKDGQFPFAVALKYKESPEKCVFHCTLSLITPRTCLGSARCAPEFYKGNKDSPCGILGTTRLGDCNNCQHISEVHKHVDPSFDIATFIFLKDVTLSDYIKPVSLIGSFEPMGACSVIVIGWGQTSRESAEPSKCLRYANVSILLEKECSFVVKYQSYCLRIDGVSPCGGDAGGPIVITYAGKALQVGISAYLDGLKCGTGRSFATDLRNYTQWIIEHSDVSPTFVKTDQYASKPSCFTEF